MTARIKGRKIASQARAHQDRRLVTDGPLNHTELSGNRQVFEAAFVELRNLHGDAECGELAAEELRFARVRAGGEAVKIHDSCHLATE